MKNVKKAIALLLAAVLLVAASVMGTIAYLTDSDADINTMSAGNVYIVQNETDRNGNKYQDGQKLIPAVYNGTLAYDGQMDNTTGDGSKLTIFDQSVNNELDKVISVTNTGTEDAFIRTIILMEENDANEILTNVHIRINTDDNQDLVWLTTGGKYDLVEVNGTKYAIAVATYETALEAKKTSLPSLMQIFLDPTIDNNWYNLLGTDGEFSIIAFSQAVQEQGFDNAENALNTAFGEVTAANVSTWIASANIKTPEGGSVINP